MRKDLVIGFEDIVRVREAMSTEAMVLDTIGVNNGSVIETINEVDWVIERIQRETININNNPDGKRS